MGLTSVALAGPSQNFFRTSQSSRFINLQVWYFVSSNIVSVAFLGFRIIATLEKLKEEAAEITRKVEETDVVMAEVEAVSDQYGALSHYCSSIYFTMEGLNLVSQTAHQWYKMWCNPGAINLICVYLQDFLDRHFLLALSKYEARIAEVQTKITHKKKYR